MEIWKDVVGYEDSYLVSNLSNVKSLKRKKWNGFAYQDIQEKLLKIKVHNGGYKQVVLCLNGKCKHLSLHRIVALAHIPNPDNKPYVGHLDNNPSNCETSNLIWCTQLENIQYGVQQGRFTKGIQAFRAKFTEEQVLEIRRKIEAKEISQCKLAKELGVTQNCISEIVNRQTWKHI